MYPSFSPTVIAFLLCSASYGLWKVRQLHRHQTAQCLLTVISLPCFLLTACARRRSLPVINKKTRCSYKTRTQFVFLLCSGTVFGNAV